MQHLQSLIHEEKRIGGKQHFFFVYNYKEAGRHKQKRQNGGGGKQGEFSIRQRREDKEQNFYVFIFFLI